MFLYFADFCIDLSTITLFFLENSIVKLDYHWLRQVQNFLSWTWRIFETRWTKTMGFIDWRDGPNKGFYSDANGRGRPLSDLKVAVDSSFTTPNYGDSKIDAGKLFFRSFLASLHYFSLN